MQVIHILLCCAVYYSTFVLMFFHIIYYTVISFPASFTCYYTKKQIWSVKPSNHCHRIFKAQTFYNIILYTLCCSRCKCAYYRTFRKFYKEILYFKITWSEILSPLRYTMRLIYCEHRYLSIAGKFKESRCIKSFRRHIDYLIAPLRSI